MIHCCPFPTTSCPTLLIPTASHQGAQQGVTKNPRALFILYYQLCESCPLELCHMVGQNWRQQLKSQGFPNSVPFRGSQVALPGQQGWEEMQTVGRALCWGGRGLAGIKIITAHGRGGGR